MKTKNLKRSFLTCTVAMMLLGCSDDFLVVDPTGTYIEETYYKDGDQAYSALVAVYDVMKKQAGGFENMTAMLNAGSDDFYAGGGGPTDGAGMQGFSNYTINPTTIPRSFWSDFYQGVSRANILLEKIPNTTMDDAVRSRIVAETKALRAYYYFQLVNMFGDIPFYTTNIAKADFYLIEKSPASTVYAQVEQDLTEAIEDLPTTLNLVTEAGRFTKGSAQALLGKVYLYEGKNAQAAPLFAEVNGEPGQVSQYGYRLLNNFADLWVIENKFNSESILEAVYTDKSNSTWSIWGSGADEGNALNQMVGPRSYSPNNSSAPTYYPGWAFNPVTTDLAAFMNGDPRSASTIADLNALSASGNAVYQPAYQDTGYFLKKFMPYMADRSTGAGNTELNFRQNMYVIRLADTYLMEAEALGGTGTRAQALLDAVRARVGLGSVPVSLTAIYNERRLELAGEGHRWLDLVRTGRAATVLASRGFIAGKHEHWPIPLKETENTKVTQNPAYN